MRMKILTLRGVPSARRALLPQASSAHLATSNPCPLQVPRWLRCRRPHSLRSSASLKQEVKSLPLRLPLGNVKSMKTRTRTMPTCWHLFIKTTSFIPFLIALLCSSVYNVLVPY